MSEEMEYECCASCQKIIVGKPIRVELEKYTHYDRVFFACSDGCADRLREGTE